MTLVSFVYCGLLELLVTALVVRQTIEEDETEAMRACVSDPVQLAATIWFTGAKMGDLSQRISI